MTVRLTIKIVYMLLRVLYGITILFTIVVRASPSAQSPPILFVPRAKSQPIDRSTMAKARGRKQSTRSSKGETDKEEKLEDDRVDCDAEEPPKPVSSDSEGDDDDDQHDHDAAAGLFQQNDSKRPSSTNSHGTAAMSRLFAPYRSLGIVTSGRPFFVLSHETATMLCVPIQDRFQILSERLQPVMVSQQVPSKGTSAISHLVADATLSITVVAAHGSRSPPRVTLFHRTRPLDSRAVRNRQSRGCVVAAMLHLGRLQLEMTGEKLGKTENAAIVAIVLGSDGHGGGGDKTTPIVGDDENDSEDGNESDDESSSIKAAFGQVVMMIASRQDIKTQSRISLDFCPVAAIHPPTYVNKIVVAGYKTNAAGDKQPTMSLINVRSAKTIHTFSCLPNQKGTWITTLEASPAVDTVAVGTSHGHVYLVNLLHDKLLFALYHKSIDKLPVSITSISFRTDSSAYQYGVAPMAVGRDDGTITVWDLTPSEEDDGSRTILTELETAHVGGVGHLQYLPHEPLLMSIGTASNAIVMHLFDSPNHTGRILRQRKGHSSPPSLIHYLHPATGGLTQHDGTDASACQILSTGGADRSLRVFSTARTVLDKEYSQGPGLEKRAKKLGIRTADLMLPPATALAASESNRRDWGDLVTIHRDHPFAYVWSTTRGAQSGPLLKQADWNISAMKKAPSRQTHATSVCMSACGHFALVGTRGGIIYKYNVQSGQARGVYPRNVDEGADQNKRRQRMPGDIGRTMEALEKKMKISNRVSNLDKQDVDQQNQTVENQLRKKKLVAASHSGFAVTGLAVDSVNKVLVSVGSDKKLILWHFTTHAPHSKSPFTLPSPATKMNHIRESDLAAIALEDFSVVLFDCTTLSIVRRFGVQGSMARHTGPITDLGFSPDARTLYTASMDSSIRVFDVPTNSCIDWLAFKSPPTSLTISPTGEYLATTHKDRFGISVWSDRSYYQTIHVDTFRSSEPTKMEEPVPMADAERLFSEVTVGSELIKQSIAKLDSEIQKDGGDGIVPCPKKKGLVTFSGLPSAHWKNLFHLELVKERNKPSEAPKKPPTAPFFLQWRSGDPVADGLGQTDTKEEGLPTKDADDEWAKAWSDDDENMPEPVLGSDGLESKRKPSAQAHDTIVVKRPKVSHVRSQLASLLIESELPSVGGRRYTAVTMHIASLGPSAIDIAFASLCNGIHDLDEGLPLLLNATSWLIEALEDGERFEAVNAYLHRFLFLHATVIAELETVQVADEQLRQQRIRLMEAIVHLRRAQDAASAVMNEKMQHTLCLLRHFSRMV